jgi:hypothetical protein
MSHITNYAVSANGSTFGTYPAASEQEARDLCAQDAGYLDEADMVERLGQQSEMIAVPADGKTRLSTRCFTVQDGQIVAGALSDFAWYIEDACRPNGVGHKFYATERDGTWVLAKWEGSNEIVVREFDTEPEARDAAEQTYVYDILHNDAIQIHLDRADAERELADRAI